MTTTINTTSPQSDEARVRQQAGGPNVNRLIDLARWLTEQERRRRLGEPSEWNQGFWVRTDGGDNVRVIDGGDGLFIEGWSCGTAACAAGHIALEDGGMPAFWWGGDYHDRPPLPGDDGWSPLQSSLDAVSETISDTTMCFGGLSESIEGYAQRVLGLSGVEAGRLFHGDNDWSTMMYLISLFTGIDQDVLVDQVGGDDMPDEDEHWCEGCQEYH